MKTQIKTVRVKREVEIKSIPEPQLESSVKVVLTRNFKISLIKRVSLPIIKISKERKGIIRSNRYSIAYVKPLNLQLSALGAS